MNEVLRKSSLISGNNLELAESQCLRGPIKNTSNVLQTSGQHVVPYKIHSRPRRVQDITMSLLSTVPAGFSFICIPERQVAALVTLVKSSSFNLTHLCPEDADATIASLCVHPQCSNRGTCS